MLLRMPDGRDVFALSASHVAMDGVGMLRVARSITRAYRGEPDPDDPVDLETARDVRRRLQPGSAPVDALARAVQEGLGYLRIAAEGR